ncbi:hypothetical protein BDW71DRAFT_32273 [Aspergillus fruticulosus]
MFILRAGPPAAIRKTKHDQVEFGEEQDPFAACFLQQVNGLGYSVGCRRGHYCTWTLALILHLLFAAAVLVRCHLPQLLPSHPTSLSSSPIVLVSPRLLSIFPPSLYS